MSDQKKSQDSSPRKTDLDQFGDKLKTAKSKYESGTSDADERANGWAVGIRYASDFSAAVLVGALLGFGVDYVLKTMPWGMLIGLLLGFAAGVRLIVQHASKANSDQG